MCVVLDAMILSCCPLDSLDAIEGAKAFELCRPSMWAVVTHLEP